MNSIDKGIRSSTSIFVEERDNMTMVSSTISKKIIFKAGKAISLTVIDSNHEEYTFRSTFELIVS
jgi:choline dehydrogenase